MKEALIALRYLLDILFDWHNYDCQLEPDGVVTRHCKVCQRCQEFVDGRWIDLVPTHMEMG